MSDDMGVGSEPWLARFRELNNPAEDVVSIDQNGDQVQDAVCGTVAWCKFAVGLDDDGDATQAALIVRFAPIGELDPAKAMHLHMKVVSPAEAIELMTQIMVCILPDELHDKIVALIREEI
jgi:hypothetical protein